MIELRLRLVHNLTWLFMWFVCSLTISHFHGLLVLDEYSRRGMTLTYHFYWYYWTPWFYRDFSNFYYSEIDFGDFPAKASRCTSEGENLRGGLDRYAKFHFRRRTCGNLGLDPHTHWCIAKNGGGYTQRGVAKGLKVPCLFMITEVSIRCPKKPRGWYTAYTRVYPIHHCPYCKLRSTLVHCKCNCARTPDSLAAYYAEQGLCICRSSVRLSVCLSHSQHGPTAANSLLQFAAVDLHKQIEYRTFLK